MTQHYLYFEKTKNSIQLLKNVSIKDLFDAIEEYIRYQKDLLLNKIFKDDPNAINNLNEVEILETTHPLIFIREDNILTFNSKERTKRRELFIDICRIIPYEKPYKIIYNVLFIDQEDHKYFANIHNHIIASFEKKQDAMNFARSSKLDDYGASYEEDAPEATRQFCIVSTKLY